MHRPEKVMGKQFEKNEGSAGANIENSPLAVIIVL